MLLAGMSPMEVLPVTVNERGRRWTGMLPKMEVLPVLLLAQGLV